MKILALLLATCVVLSGSSIAGATVAEPTEPKIQFIIGFHEGVSISDLADEYGFEVQNGFKFINAVSAKGPKSIMEALRGHRGIKYIELNGILHKTGETLPWGVDRIDAELVHPYNKGTGIKVAVIDTGIDYDHPDLAANYRGGYDFVNKDSDPMDDEGHGTHCAGIIAAVVGNQIGVVGVAPEAHLYAVKVLNSEGSGYLSDVIAGIEWAVEHGMHVISMSLGTTSDYQSLHDACDKAYAKGVLAVAAAGNNASRWSVRFGRDTVIYPAKYDSVIAVGATDQNDVRARWSSTGPALELVAPGVDIYSTYWDDTYATASGTSMACPHVSGTAALVFTSSVDPAYDSDGDGQWDASEVRQKLRDTADDLGDSGWDPQYGYGIVDADEAAAQPPTPEHDIAITDIVTPSSAIKGDLVSVDVTAANLGDFDENFTVTLTDTTDSVEVGSQAVTLTAEASTALTFSWDTTTVTVGDHILEAVASTVPEETDLTNNSKTTTVTVRELTHDVAVTTIDVPSQVALEDVVTVKVSVANQGDFEENFTVFLTDTTDNNEIGTQPVTLVAGDSTTLSFNWNTTSTSLGDHLLEARASVVDGETDEANNVKTATVSVIEAKALSVTVSTDKDTYKWYNKVYITVVVTDGTSPVEGATVDVTVTRPDGAVATGSGTTDSEGVAKFSYRPGWRAPKGTYTVYAEASKSGYMTGSASTTFEINSSSRWGRRLWER